MFQQIFHHGRRDIIHIVYTIKSNSISFVLIVKSLMFNIDNNDNNKKKAFHLVHFKLNAFYTLTSLF